MNKKMKEELSEVIEESTGMKVVNVLDVWSNGKASRKYIGQDKLKSYSQELKVRNGYKRMIAVYIEVDEDV